MSRYSKPHERSKHETTQKGIAKDIDGYFGMWDDFSKIDKQHDDKFRKFLKKNHISPFTFNGRDFCFNFRIRVIKYDIITSIQSGLQLIKKRNKVL